MPGAAADAACGLKDRYFDPAGPKACSLGRGQNAYPNYKTGAVQHFCFAPAPLRAVEE